MIVQPPPASGMAVDLWYKGAFYPCCVADVQGIQLETLPALETLPELLIETLPALETLPELLMETLPEPIASSGLSVARGGFG